MYGFNLITDGVRHLLSTSTCQVEGAQPCLITAGEVLPTSAIILRAAEVQEDTGKS